MRQALWKIILNPFRWQGESEVEDTSKVYTLTEPYGGFLEEQMLLM